MQSITAARIRAMLMKPWMKPVMGCVLAWNIFVVVLQVYLHMATPLDMHDTSGVAQLGDRAMHPLPLDGLKRAFAAVTIDLEASEAEKAALETRISLLKRERRRLEAELTRELAAAGKTPPPTSIMQLIMQPSLVEAAPSASASDAGPYHGSGSVADTHTGGVGQAAWSAADAPVTASSRKRKRKGKAPAATAPTAAIYEQAPTDEKRYACSICPQTRR